MPASAATPNAACGPGCRRGGRIPAATTGPIHAIDTAGGHGELGTRRGDSVVAFALPQ
jgi:hypothetical protein